MYPLICAALFSCALTVSAADWPQWRGPHGTGHAAKGEPSLNSLPGEATPLWKQKAGPGLASPVKDGDRVFVFDTQDGKETLRALEARSGKEIWRTAIDEPFSDSQGPTGPRCTPVVSGDYVLAQSGRGELQCLKRSNGEKVWSVNYVKDFSAEFTGEKGNAQGAARHGYNGSPLVVENKVYVGAGGTNGAGIVCLEKKTGKVLWKSLKDQAGYAPAVLEKVGTENQLVSFTAEGLVAVNPKNGELLWRTPMKTAYSRHVMTPVVFENRVLAGSHTTGLLGTQVTPGNPPKAVVAWTNKEASPNFASGVAVGKYLFGLGATKNVICVDMATGQTLWSQTGLVLTSADKAHAGFVVIGKNILMLNDTGELILFSADEKAFRELGRLQVCGTNWCNPAYADGVLYFRDGKEWGAVSLR